MTFATLRDDILSDIGRTDLSSQVEAAINRAVARYEKTPFYFNQSVQTFSTVADQEYYSSSDDADIPYFFKVYSGMVTISSIKCPMSPRSQHWMDRRNNGAVTGPPRHWGFFNQQIRLSPVPDSVYTITMSAIYRLANVPYTDDADTNAWDMDAEELIRNAAKRDVWGNIIRNHQQAAWSKGEEMDALKDLKRETARQTSQGLLSTDVPTQGHFDINTGDYVS